ncbi:MAG: L,D-transpeptidase family protein [Verrucomicrobiales bacterium]|nr:L,D-transpeptidase family protein [Verrucomicrobiales bacterium]MCP5558159.1 L,D-transpeptidase family protein [Verrucomicrobiaceae bacterium]
MQLPSLSIRSALIGAFALPLASCVAPKDRQAPPQPLATQNVPPPTLFEWNGEGVPGETSVRIDLDTQRATIYKAGKEVGWTTVATGIYKFPTPIGKFKIQEKTADKKSNLWGRIYDSDGDVVTTDGKMGRDKIPVGGKFEGARMPFWMRLTGDGIGMHAGPIPNPGHRASHGCIRMPREMAPILFANVRIGTPVTIVGDGPVWRPSRPKPMTEPKTGDTAIPNSSAPPAIPASEVPPTEPPSGPSETGQQ